MKIIRELPPNIDELDRVFGVRKMLETSPVWFAFGDRIYNPNRVDIPPAIMVHELVHCDRQKRLGGGPEMWWKAYLEHPDYRLAEEIPAHQAEYQWQLEHDQRGPPMGYRTRAAFHLTNIALRLASPLYGSLVPLSEAKRLISA